MRIENLRLSNFIGVKEGCGLNELSLEIPKGPPIILLSGGNGSGKTTLMSHLQPFHTNNDGRRNAVIEGMEGAKEIVIRDNDSLFKVRHAYRPNKDGGHSIKSFISVMKDGEWDELNRSGGVRSFSEHVAERLGITTDFFQVGRIGDNVRNFIELNSSDRKRFISKFLPNIDPYLAANKQASANLRSAKRNAEHIGRELAEIGDEARITADLDDMAQRERVAAKSLEEVIESIGKARGQLSSVEAGMDGAPDYSENHFSAQVAEIQRDIDTLSKALSTTNEIDKEKLEKDRISTKNKILEANSLKKAKNAERSTIRDEMARLKKYLDDVDITETKLQNLIHSLESTKRELAEENAAKSVFQGKTSYSQFFKPFIDKYDANSFSAAKSDLTEITNSVKRLLSVLSDLRGDLVMHAEFLEDPALLTKELKESKDAHKTAASALNQAKRKVSHLGLGSHIIQTPGLESCDSDECPYEHLADMAKQETSHKSAEEAVQKAEADVEREAQAIKDCEKASQVIEQARKSVVRGGWKAAGEAVRSGLVFPADDFVAEVLEAAASDNLQKALHCSSRPGGMALKDHAAEWLENLRIIAAKEAEVEKLEVAAAEAKRKDENRRRLQEDLSGCEDRLRKVDAEIAVVDRTLAEETDREAVLDKNAADLMVREKAQVAMEKARNSEREAKSKDDAQRKGFSERMALSTKITELSVRRAELEAEVSQSRKRTMELQSLLTQRKDRVNREEELKTSMILYESVKRATDLTKGILLYLSQSYLEDIRTISNTLLEIPYKGLLSSRRSS